MNIGTYEILSVGDGLFMSKVLGAIAMLSNSGMFLSIGFISAMLGILLLAANYLASGELKMTGLAAGILFFVLMFKTTATVQVSDVGIPPGMAGEASYLVSNVPGGIAVMGYLVSQMGTGIAERMEQSFSGTNDISTMREQGFGRSLDWLAAVRYGKSLGGTGNPNIEMFKNNLINYMSACSSVGFIRNGSRPVSAVNADDPLAESAFGFISETVATKWQSSPTSDEQTSMSCKEAHGLLVEYTSGSDLFEDWADSIAGLNSKGGMNDPAFDAYEAMANLGLEQEEAQKFVKASVMRALWTTAASRIPYFGSQESNNILMMTQAHEQMATQHAAEESSFRRLMRPLMAFFETLLYASAPFMAFVVCLGVNGLKMVGRYAILSLWVALWMPILAVINLYQNTMAARAIASITDAASGSSLSMGSIAGSGYVENAAIDWINTGAMLAANTPAITLMILFGSAMTAVGLSGALKGRDHVNERLSTPDAVSPAPAMKVDSLESHSSAAGTTKTGASIPSINLGTAATQSLIASETHAQGALASWAKSDSFAVTSMNAKAVGQSFAANSGASITWGQTEQAVRSATFSDGSSSGITSDVGHRLAQSIALASRAGGSIDIHKAMKGIAAAAGIDLDREPQNKEEEAAWKKATRNLLGAFGISASADITTRDGFEKVGNSILQASRAYQQALNTGRISQGQLAAAVSEGTQDSASVTSTTTDSATGQTNLVKNISDTASILKASQVASTRAMSAQQSQTIPYQNASNDLVRSGLVGEATNRARQEDSAGFIKALEGFKRGNTFGDFNSNRDQYMAAAAYAVLFDNVPGHDSRRPDMNAYENAVMLGQRASYGMELLDKAGTLAVSSSSNPTANTGLQSGQYNPTGFNNDHIVKPGEALNDVSANEQKLGARPGAEARALSPINEEDKANVANSVLKSPDSLQAGVVAALENGESMAFGDGGVDSANNNNKNFVDNSSQAAISGSQQMSNESYASEIAKGTAPGGRGLGRLIPEESSIIKDMSAGVMSGAMVGQSAAFVRNMVEGSPVQETDNPSFEKAVSQMQSGQQFGYELQSDASIVLAGIKTVNEGGKLSEGQLAQINAAWNSMSPERQEAVRQLDRSWAEGESHPKFSTGVHLDALSKSNEQFANSANYSKDESGFFVQPLKDAVRAVGIEVDQDRKTF